MTSLMMLFAWNLALCVPFGLLIWCLCRIPAIQCRPSLCHAMWALVLVKLVTPPLIALPVLPAQHVATPIAETTVFTELDNRVQSIPPLATPAPPQTDLGRPVAMPDVAATPVFAAPQVPVSRWNWMAIVLRSLISLSLIVTATFWTRALLQARRLNRLLAYSSISPKPLEQMLARLGAQFGRRNLPKLAVVDAAISPIVWTDLQQPVIVLPQSLIDQLDEEGLNSVVAHELAHLVRRDHVTNLFSFLVTTLLWWHPIAWLARREMNLAAEACCDALAVQVCGKSRKEYARTLLAVVDFINVGCLSQPSLAVNFGGSPSLMKRMEMLANARVRAGISVGGWMLLALALMSSVFMPARAQEPKQPEKPAAKPNTDKPSHSAETSNSKPANAQPGKYFVSGTVIDEVSRQPVPNAKLRFIVDGEPDRSKSLRTTTADENGRFRIETRIGTTKLWFPELAPGYWLPPQADQASVVTTKDQPDVTMEVAAKRGPVWPFQVSVEGGLPEGAVAIASLMEMEDDEIRQKAVDGKQWALMKHVPQMMCWSDSAGRGALTQCGSSGKLYLSINIMRDPQTKPGLPFQFVPLFTELIIGPAFDALNVKSATPIADTDNVELIDGAGAKAIVRKMQVEIVDGRPLLKIRLANSKSSMEVHKVAGRLVDREGSPVPDVTIRTAIGVEKGGSGETEYQTTSNQDGRFQLEIPTREMDEKVLLSLIFNKDGYAAMDSRRISLPKKAGKSIDAGTIKLTPGYTAKFRVVDKNDRPIEGALIEPMGSYAERHVRDTTGEGGRVTIKNLPKGVVTVSVEHGGAYAHPKIVVYPGDQKEHTVRLEVVVEELEAASKKEGEGTRVALGTQAPELTVSKWTDGKQHNLSDYRGRVVVIDFWGIWCGGCVTSIPMLRDLAEKYEPQKVVFLGIHTPDGELGQIDDLKKLHNWKTLTGIDAGKTIGDGETAKRFGVQGYPTILIVDSEGKIAFTTSAAPKEEEKFKQEVEEIAKSLGISWPPDEDDEELAILQMNKIFGTMLGREIEKAIAKQP